MRCKMSTKVNRNRRNYTKSGIKQSKQTLKTTENHRVSQMQRGYLQAFQGMFLHMGRHMGVPYGEPYGK